MIHFNEQAERLTGQPMFVLLDRIKKLEQAGHDIVHFEIGDPAFTTPSKIIQAGHDALDAGYTHYTSSAGLPELKHEIMLHYQTYFSKKIDFDAIVVAPGANPLIWAVIQCLIRSDENVVIPSPGFPTYESVLNFLGIPFQRWTSRSKQQFRPLVEDLIPVLNPKTKLIIINSPNNPTGAVMTPDQLQKLLVICEQRNIFLMTDEIYSLILYEMDRYQFQKNSIVSYVSEPFLKKKLIILNGFSKAYAMTGWRLGYLVGPTALCQKISLLLQTTISCTNTFVQKAGADVLAKHFYEYEDNLKQLTLARNVMCNGLKMIKHISITVPEGAFYIFVNIRKTKLTSDQFCDLMLNAGVAMLPGESFGPNGVGYVRICFARPIEEIEKGLKRMREVAL